MKSLPDHVAQSDAPSQDVAARMHDLELMQSLGITFGDGHYSISGYRYGQLSEAVHYATLKAQRIAS